MNIGIAEIRNNLADAINRVVYGGERVILERRGKPAAALISLADLKLLEEIEDREDVRAARRARKEKGTVTLDEIKMRLGMK